MVVIEKEPFSIAATKLLYIMIVSLLGIGPVIGIIIAIANLHHPRRKIQSIVMIIFSAIMLGGLAILIAFLSTVKTK